MTIDEIKARLNEIEDEIMLPLNQDEFEALGAEADHLTNLLENPEQLDLDEADFGF